MKRVIILTALILMTVLTYSQNAKIKEVSSDQFKQLITRPGGVLLDVHKPLP